MKKIVFFVLLIASCKSQIKNQNNDLVIKKSIGTYSMLNGEKLADNKSHEIIWYNKKGQMTKKIIQICYSNNCNRTEYEFNSNGDVEIEKQYQNSSPVFIVFTKFDNEGLIQNEKFINFHKTGIDTNLIVHKHEFDTLLNKHETLFLMNSEVGEKTETIKNGNIEIMKKYKAFGNDLKLISQIKFTNDDNGLTLLLEENNLFDRSTEKVSYKYSDTDRIIESRHFKNERLFMKTEYLYEDDQLIKREINKLYNGIWENNIIEFDYEFWE